MKKFYGINKKLLKSLEINCENLFNKLNNFGINNNSIEKEEDISDNLYKEINDIKINKNNQYINKNVHSFNKFKINNKNKKLI